MDDHKIPFITRIRFGNATCDRLIAHLGGWAEVGASMRWPCRPIPATAIPRLRGIVRTLLPDFIP